jgi:hypothetical protein
VPEVCPHPFIPYASLNVDMYPLHTCHHREMICRHRLYVQYAHIAERLTLAHHRTLLAYSSAIDKGMQQTTDPCRTCMDSVGQLSTCGHMNNRAHRSYHGENSSAVDATSRVNKSLAYICKRCKSCHNPLGVNPSRRLLGWTSSRGNLAVATLVQAISIACA